MNALLWATANEIKYKEYTGRYLEDSWFIYCDKMTLVYE